MIVLTPSTSTQNFSYVPRVLGNAYNDIPTTMIIKDEQTNISVSTTTHTLNWGYYVNIIYDTFSLKEGHFYTLQFLNPNNDIIYKDRIFCTAQSLVTFSVNNNQYVSNATTNEFIVYE